jgi:hypothetical protein
MIKTCIGLHVKYSLFWSDVNENLIVDKYSDIKFHENPPIASRKFFYADRRKDGNDKANSRY